MILLVLLFLAAVRLLSNKTHAFSGSQLFAIYQVAVKKEERELAKEAPSTRHRFAENQKTQLVVVQGYNRFFQVLRRSKERLSPNRRSEQNWRVRPG